MDSQYFEIMPKAGLNLDAYPFLRLLGFSGECMGVLCIFKPPVDGKAAYMTVSSVGLGVVLLVWSYMSIRGGAGRAGPNPAARCFADMPSLVIFFCCCPLTSLSFITPWDKISVA